MQFFSNLNNHNNFPLISQDLLKCIYKINFGTTIISFNNSLCMLVKSITLVSQILLEVSCFIFVDMIQNT